MTDKKDGPGKGPQSPLGAPDAAQKRPFATIDLKATEVPEPKAPPVATPAPRVFIEEETVEERRGPDPWMYVLGAVILIAIVALVWALVARDDSPAKATVPAVTGLPGAVWPRLGRCRPPG